MYLHRLAKIALVFFRKLRTLNSGQIGRRHEIGRWIELLASLSTVSTIVEIGTWNGKGSSMAIARGVRSRKNSGWPKVDVVGFEVNPKMARSAERALRRFDFFEVIFGSIVNIDDLDRANLSESEKIWLNQDEEWIRQAPNVLASVPETIDLLVLDGGEFSTLAEYKALSARVTGWIIMDDTRTRKCSEILKIARKEGIFEIMYLSDERNGMAILKRISRVN